MTSIFSTILALFIMVPILLFYVLFLLMKFVIKNGERAFQLSADVTTIFFILSVHFLIIAIWNLSMLFIFILFMILFMMVFTWIYWKMTGQIRMNKIIHGFWRLNFLVFAILYLFLMFFGVFTSAFANLAN